jgi:hypothetical protein
MRQEHPWTLHEVRIAKQAAARSLFEERETVGAAVYFSSTHWLWAAGYAVATSACPAACYNPIHCLQHSAICLALSRLICKCCPLVTCRVWSDHQTKTLQQELSCPLCRCPWGKLDWSPPAAPAATAGGKAAAHARLNCHKGVSCSGCHQVRTRLYPLQTFMAQFAQCCTVLLGGSRHTTYSCALMLNE